MSYTPVFEKPYPNGYKDKPIKTTPITASTLNDKDAALEHIEDYLETNPIIDVEANPVLSGTEEALESIKIGNEKYKIEGGGASTEIIANDYDAEKTYNEGEYCAYNNTIWKSLSISEGETPEEGEYWTEVVVMDEVEIAMNSGGSANIWEGSHAEYEEEKSQIPDETTLLFNDDIGLEAESDYYSEVEQVIGTYLGKPLYRKVLTGNITPSSGTYSIVVGTLSALGADFITKISGFIQNTEQGILYKMAIPSYVNSTNASGVYISGTGDIRLYITGTYHKYSLVLEYTKTTDSVVGVVGGIKKGDNYSTNEQVIGTWIDGKPLYQKTIELTVPSSGRQNVNHNIQNIKKVIGYEGGFNSPSGNLYANPFGSIERWTSDVYKRMIYQITPTYIDVETASENYAMTITIKYTKTTD